MYKDSYFLETVWVLFLGFIIMCFLSDQGIFERHSRAMGRKNNDEIAQKTHKKTEGLIPNGLLKNCYTVMPIFFIKTVAFVFLEIPSLIL